ncbi:MAG: HAD family phosphatase [Bacillota bacterium]|nr:HAD family phosphatase [Bacillota bacterium]
MPDFKAALFDLDGTVIDSMGVWEKIDIDFLAKRGQKVPKNYAAELAGLSFQRAAEYSIELFNFTESPAEIIDEWNGMAIYEYGHNIKLKPYAKEFLAYLKGNGIKLAVTTALSQNLYEPVLKNNGIYDMFDVFTSTDDIKREKNCPDLYLYACRKLGVSPQNCIGFDDVCSAIKGMKIAGIKAYGVYDKYSEHEKDAIIKIADGYILNFGECLRGKF